jgi:O-antigen ligase/Tfp pilus assembly protein PilF
MFWLPVAGLICLLTAVFLIGLNRHKLSARLNPGTDLPLLGFLGWAFVSCISSINREESLFEVMRMSVLVMVYFLAAYAVTGKSGRRTLALALVGIGFIEAVYGLIEFISGKALLDLEWMPRSVASVSGTLRSHNHFAGLMEMSVFLCFGLILAAPRDRTTPSRRLSQRLLLSIPVGFMILALVLSLSRGGWASFILGSVFLVWLYWWQANPRWSRVLYLVLALMALVGAFMAGVNRAPLANRLETLRGFYERPGDITASTRISLWKSSIDMVRDRPLTGTGPGTFRSAYPKYRRDHIFAGASFSHNDYLQIAATTGLPGLGLFLLFIVMIFRRGLRVIRSKERDFRARAMPGVLAAIFAVLVHEFVDFNLMLPSNAMIFFALSGIVASRDTLIASAPQRSSLSKAAVDVLTVTMLTFFFARSGQLFLAELFYQRGEEQTRSASFEEGIASYDRALGILPERALYQRTAGRACLRFYNSRPVNQRPLFRAFHAFRQALKLEPAYPYNWFGAGKALLLLEEAAVTDMPSPETYFQRAVEIDPTNPLFLSALIDWELRHGRKDRAMKIFPRLTASYPGGIKIFGDRLLQSDKDHVWFSGTLDGNPAAIYGYAYYLYRNKRLEMAAAQIRRIPEPERSQRNIASLFADILEAQDKMDEAKQVLERAFSADPGDERVARRLARFLVKGNDFPGAIRVYLKATDENPKRWKLNLELARLAEKTGQDDLALEHYTAALGSGRLNDRQKKQLYAARAAVRYKLGNLRGSLADYEMARELAPEDKKIARAIERIKLEMKYGHPRK